MHLFRGRLEVRHARRFGPLPWLLWELFRLVRQTGLELPDLVRALPGGPTAMLDLKGRQPLLGERVRDLIDEQAPGLPYAVCTRRWSLLDAFAGLPHVRVLHSARTRGELERLPARLAAHRTWGVVLHRSLVEPAVVERFREHAETLLTWPVDSDEVYHRVVAAGVGGVIADDLSALPLG